MTNLPTVVRVCVMALIVAGLVTPVASQVTRPNFLEFVDSRDRFLVEFPKDWTWTIVTPSGEPFAMFEQKKSEAAVTVERFRSRVEIAPEEISDLTADLEAQLLKENQPAVSELNVKMVTFGRRRIIVLDYTRPGLDEPERARQYTFLVGSNIYRLSCFSLRRLFSTYLGICESMAESFRPAGEFTPSAR